jgi:glycerol kinase
MKYILSIDQGTTGSTALLIDENLNIVGKKNVEYPQIFPQMGWVEHNPEDIWNSVKKSVKIAIEESKIDINKIKAIGITNQRETVSIWNKNTGVHYHNFIVWQDRRTAKYCDLLKEKGYESKISNKTGLLLDPYFSGTKIRWILNNVDSAREAVESKEAIAGTIDTFLAYRLSNKKIHVTDVSNASRYMLMDLKKLKWDKELCSLLGIDCSILPKISESSEIYGHTEGLDFLPDGIPIAGIAGDQQSALFGQACFKKGEGKCTYGTGSFILMNTGSEIVKSKNRLLTTVAWKLNGKTTYAIEGSAFIAGALVQWIRDGINFIDDAPEIEKLAKTVEDNGGVVIVPALTGLGAPFWRADLQGMIYGISRNTNRGHIARAVLEAIALQNYELLKAMEKDTKLDLIKLKVDGGASLNDLLIQFQSDILNVTLERPKMIETTALGAAMLAGLSTGIFKGLGEIQDKWHLDKAYYPSPNEYVETAIDRWELAIRKILTV